MNKTVIMWSGGADSTCVVDQMLRNTTDELVLHHIFFENSLEDGEGAMNARVLKHRAIANAQLVAIKQIANYWKRDGYRSFVLDVNYYRLPREQPHGSHGVAAPFLGALAVRNHHADRYITGINPITLRDENSSKRHETHEALFSLLMEHPVSTTRVQNDLSLPGYKVTGLLGDRSYSHVKWEKPLVEWGWGKRGVVKRLPPELRRLVVSCDNPTTGENHWERCGECFRCNKWADVGGLDDGEPNLEIGYG